MAVAKYDHVIKLLILGDAGVGKTSLLRRYIDDDFGSSFISTIGVDFRIRTVDIEDEIVKLQIWDTAGQERFRTIITAYYRGAHGILLCYDVTCPSSFENCSHWLCDVRKDAAADVNIMLVATKCDGERERAVSLEQGQTFAAQHADWRGQQIGTSRKVEICEYEKLKNTNR